MPHNCGCSVTSTHSEHRCCSSSRCDGSSHASQLRDENVWLVQQLAISEATTHQWQARVQDLRRHVRALEEQLTLERTQWQRTLERQEQEWTSKYDHHMESLMTIIAHHEETQRVLQDQVQGLPTHAKRIDMSTQTDPFDGAFQAVDDREVGHVCLHLEEQPDSEEQSTAQTTDMVTTVPAPADSIHEQYVTLTMQKLLDQLRQSNLQSLNQSLDPVLTPTSSPHVVSKARTSFRESIRRRLTATADESVIQSRTQPHEKITGRTTEVPSKLPILHEHEVVSEFGAYTSGLRSQPQSHFFSPSAA